MKSTRFLNQTFHCSLGHTFIQLSPHLVHHFISMSITMDDVIGDKHDFHVDIRHKRRETVNSTDIGLHERKSNKTNVFSGISRSVSIIKPLQELCVDKLYKQLNKLVINEDMDYKTIRPLLKRCSATELRRLETLCPALASQTDEIWLELCRNEFHFTTDDNNDHNYYNNCVPNKTSQESWHHFYWRSVDYRKRKLEEITESIRLKTDGIRSSRKVTKVCELEPKIAKQLEPKVTKKVETMAKKKPRSAPLMRKCLAIKRQRFML
ncbi:unnamed protein product [Oppiella nova]|uniref:Elongin-A n=1 Tax=Oppiella nova TaxID=334625 RepID=A0A7R9QWG9_9ACAR|nr:unnamed protein product [Oppiella nova]CAG2176891.1 unnamed protein product [Oppiella nova]